MGGCKSKKKKEEEQAALASELSHLTSARSKVAKKRASLAKATTPPTSKGQPTKAKSSSAPLAKSTSKQVRKETGKAAPYEDIDAGSVRTQPLSSRLEPPTQRDEGSRRSEWRVMVPEASDRTQDEPLSHSSAKKKSDLPATSETQKFRSQLERNEKGQSGAPVKKKRKKAKKKPHPDCKGSGRKKGGSTRSRSRSRSEDDSDSKAASSRKSSRESFRWPKKGKGKKAEHKGSLAFRNREKSQSGPLPRRSKSSMSPPSGSKSSKRSGSKSSKSGSKSSKRSGSKASKSPKSGSKSSKRAKKNK